jgi:hypothetical protein
MAVPVFCQLNPAGIHDKHGVGDVSTGRGDTRQGRKAIRALNPKRPTEAGPSRFGSMIEIIFDIFIYFCKKSNSEIIWGKLWGSKRPTAYISRKSLLKIDLQIKGIVSNC